MGWGRQPKEPTGYWVAWIEGLRGIPPRFKADSKEDVIAQFKAEYGREPDHAMPEHLFPNG